MNSKIKKIILAIVICIFLVATGYGISLAVKKYKLLEIAEKKKKLAVSYDDTFKTLLNGEAGQAVEEYRRIMASAKSQGIKQSSGGRGLLQLAIAEEKNGEYGKSLYNYKKVISDKNKNSDIRAIAYTHVAELVLVLPDKFLEEKFFNDDKYRKYFFENDPFATKEELVLISDSLFDTAPNAYELANIYAEKMLVDLSKNKLTAEQKKNLERKFLEETKKAQSVFDSVKPNEWDADRLLICNLNKARIGDKLIKINNSKFDQLKMNEVEIENLFKKSLEISKDPFASLGPENYEYFTRLYYASFLNNFYGEKRSDDIKNILTPVYNSVNSVNSGFFVFLQKERKYPDDTYHKQEIISLSKIDSRFADLLKEAGW